MYFLFLSSFLINSERSVEFEENGDEKKNHTCVNGVEAPRNIPYILVTPEVSHAPMSSLKDDVDKTQSS